MRINWDERNAQNISHAQSPQVGDYWEEMFSGCYLIVAVTPSLVAVCEDKKEVDPNHWCWDTSKCTVYTREQFNTKVRYNTASMNHKTWCDVRPRALLTDAEEAKNVAIRAIVAYKRVANPSWLTRFKQTVRTWLKVRVTALAEAL